MEGLPRALIITSRDEVIANNNVLYRLVQPLDDRSGVKSTDRLVNVVPFRRIYTFSSKTEIAEFSDMLLKRPLVLQPILHFGRGLGHACGACYNQEPWVVMVNQTHPKILSRLQMGLESARMGIERGQAVEIKFRFGKVIERVYREHLKQKELAEADQATNSVARCMTYFRYAEWEHADLILRYHGLSSRAERKAHQLTAEGQPIKGKTTKWDFEDVTSEEILWSMSDVRVYNKAHLSPVNEEEIREVLPEWTINSVSPLDYIGDTIPEHSYSYAQAGRLYESFRKKKRQRPTLENLPDLGATGGVDSSSVSPEDVAVEHDFSKHTSETDRYRSRARQYYNEPSPVGPHHDEYDNDYHHSQGYTDSRDEAVWANDIDYYRDNSSSHVQHVPKQSDDFRSPQPLGHSPAHIHAQVEVTPTASHSAYHGASNQRGDNYTRPRLLPQDDSPFVRKQDSDSSSHSTNADSGYCPEGDGRRSRGDSYDSGYPSVPAKAKKLLHNGKGRENPAFHHEEEDNTDIALQRHKELVAKMLREQNAPGSLPDPPRSPYSRKQVPDPPVKGYNGDIKMAPPRQKRLASSNSNTEIVAESFI